MIRNVVSVGALLALMIGSFLAIGEQGVHWFGGGETRRLATLVVRDANGLIPRSPVLLRGVPVGEVSSITPDSDDVAVNFWYPNTVHLPVDSTFRIENLSALGETYLSIKPNRDGGPTLADNQRIVADSATVTGTIGEMAVAVTRLFGDLDPHRVNNIVDELDTAFSDTTAIPGLGDASLQINAVVKDNESQIRDLLLHLQTILGTGDGVGSALTALPGPLLEASEQLKTVVEGAVVLCYESAGKYPDDLRNGALVVLKRVNAFEDEIGPNVYNLATPLLPPMQATAAAMATIDTSRLLDATMAAVETPGAFTVHVLPAP